jgi:hypothetical protein
MLLKIFAGVVLTFATLVASAHVEVRYLRQWPKVQFACITLFSYTSHSSLAFPFLYVRRTAAWVELTFPLTSRHKNARLEKTIVEKISTASVTPQYTFQLARRAKNFFVTIASIAATNFTRTNSLTTILIRGGFCVILYHGLRTAGVAPALLGDTARQTADVFWTKKRTSVKSGCKNYSWRKYISFFLILFFLLVADCGTLLASKEATEAAPTARTEAKNE